MTELNSPAHTISSSAPAENRFNSHESIELWYRNLRPDTDINDISLSDHVDALASSMLLYNIRSDEALPDDKNGRTLRALEYTTAGSDKLAGKIATEGTSGFTILDLMTELTEREATLPPQIMTRILDFGIKTAYSIRENPVLLPSDRLAANNRVSNLRIAHLSYLQRNAPDKVPSFSDEFIKIVREEAQWVGNNATSATSGSLFESLVGCLGKYQAWAQELDESVYLRHATLREDQPSRTKDGGSGHKYAHDVTVSGPNGQEAWLQCKWGSGSEELRYRYDESKITFVVETGDNGALSNSRELSAAFKDIALSASSAESSSKCDELSDRFKIGNILRRVSEPREAAAGRHLVLLAQK